MSLLKDIKSLGEQLPQKDKSHFDKFIKERQFDNALDLVNSIITLSELAPELPNISRAYIIADKEPLLLLQQYLSKYVDQLYIDIDSLENN